MADGVLQVSGSGPSFALFGDPEWDHLTVVAVIARADTGSNGGAPGPLSAGIGFGLATASGAPRGLFATVEIPAGGGPRLVVRRRDSAGGALTELEAAELPAELATATDPVALEVTSFDDRLRATVGETIVEVDRGEIRAGRPCLTADGPATFRTVQVRGLDLYAFPFGVSRFRSFEDHIGSWEGRLDEIAPDVLGPGTTTATVAELWNAIAVDVATVMAPEASSAERERVFAAWVAGLGLPLQDDVTTLELSRIVEGAHTVRS